MKPRPSTQKKAENEADKASDQTPDPAKKQEDKYQRALDKFSADTGVNRQDMDNAFKAQKGTMARHFDSVKAEKKRIGDGGLWAVVGGFCASDDIANIFNDTGTLDDRIPYFSGPLALYGLYKMVSGAVNISNTKKRVVNTVKEYKSPPAPKP